MTEEAIIDRVRRQLEGVDVVTAAPESGAPEIAWGDTFFTYDPDHRLASSQQFPFATIVTKDYGDFDRASNLDRPGVFRLNVGVSARTYEIALRSGGGAPSRCRWTRLRRAGHLAAASGVCAAALGLCPDSQRRGVRARGLAADGRGARDRRGQISPTSRR